MMRTIVLSVLALLFGTATGPLQAPAVSHHSTVPQRAVDLAASVKVDATPATAPVGYFKVIDETQVPASAANSASSRWWIDVLDSDGLLPQSGTGRESPLLPSAFDATPTVVSSGFDGLTGAFSGGVARPDQAIAAGPKGILQAINGGSVALYDHQGHMAAGWPKTAQSFFGLPATDYMVDDRAAYDSWAHRYWVTFGDQEQKPFYVAVSQTSDPNGKWNVYGFDVDEGNTQWDFNMFGFDRNTISLSTRLLTVKGSKVTSEVNAFYTVPKAPLLAGSAAITATGFSDVRVGGFHMINVMPVLDGASSEAQPPGELFVAMLDDSWCSVPPSACRHMAAFMLSGSNSSVKLSAVLLPTPPYMQTPLAGTPACSHCLEAVGPMMSTPAVYSNGLIDFSTGAAVSGYAHGTPGVFWGQIRPSYSGASLASASLVQKGLLALPGASAFLPSVMTDAAGTLYVLFNGSGSNLFPSVYVAARRPGDPAGRMGPPKLVVAGLASPPSSWYGYYFPYGDYTAASFDPSSGVWLSSQYAQTSTTYGDYIANVRL